MLDFTTAIATAVEIHDLALLAEAVDELDALFTSPLRGHEYGPTVSDIRQAAHEVVEIAQRVNDETVFRAATTFAAEVLREVG